MKIIILLFFVVGVTCDRRVYGGKNINISETPYLVAVLWNDDGSYYCSGSLISENFALSAAHCFPDHYESWIFKIRAGSSDANQGGVLLDIEEIIIHPSYNFLTQNYDFALLRLESEISFPKVVEFAKLPENDDVKIGEMMRIGGWGKNERNDGSPHLIGAQVPIYDIEKCKKAYKKFNLEITDEMICAGYEEGKIDTCGGNLKFYYL